MLAPNIDEITPDHIASLVNEKVAERRTLDYKEKLPGGTDDEKKEFLSDVCSFANLNGGDIIYGVSDERGADGKPTGVPGSIVGLTSANLSSERDRLESMVRDGIRPRIPNLQTKDIQVPGQGPVLVLRVARSWIKPHMVTFKGSSRFYSRHSTGKYQLDVQEIGQAFAEQRSLGEQLRNWRADRIARILSDEGPLRLDGPSKLLVHFIPASFIEQQVGLWPVPSDARLLFRPSSLSSSTASRYNADGFLVYSLKGADDCASYVQLFRNGCLEYADGYILNVGRHYGQGQEKEIPSKSFEQKLVEAFGNALLIARKFGIDDPVYFCCTLIGVQGMRLSRTGLFEIGGGHTFDRPVIQSPEAQIDRADQRPYRRSVLPVVDSVWQANGYEETPWRDPSGEWNPYLP